MGDRIVRLPKFHDYRTAILWLHTAIALLFLSVVDMVDLTEV